MFSSRSAGLAPSFLAAKSLSSNVADSSIVQKPGSLASSQPSKKRPREALGDFVKKGLKQAKHQSKGLSDPSGSAKLQPSKAQEKKPEVDEDEAQIMAEVKKLKKDLHKSQEKTDYWRRKSLDLETVLSQKKAANMKTISALEEKIEEMTEARLQLQAKLADDTATNEKALDEITGLLEVQSGLQKDKDILIDEIQTMMSSCDEAREERWSQIEELKTCLADTLGDLKVKLAELTTAKEALARAKSRVVDLEAKTRDQEDTTADKAASDELQQTCDRRAKRITLLTELVEKLVFKASVLSQTNTELEAKAGGGAAAKPVDSAAPHKVDKMEMLEKMCLRRYSKIMREAAGRVYEAKSLGN